MSEVDSYIINEDLYTLVKEQIFLYVEKSYDIWYNDGFDINYILYQNENVEIKFDIRKILLEKVKTQFLEEMIKIDEEIRNFIIIAMENIKKYKEIYNTEYNIKSVYIAVITDMAIEYDVDYLGYNLYKFEYINGMKNK